MTGIELMEAQRSYHPIFLARVIDTSVNIEILCFSPSNFIVNELEPNLQSSSPILVVWLMDVLIPVLCSSGWT